MILRHSASSEYLNAPDPSYLMCCDLQIPDVAGYEPGQALNVEDLFKVGDIVDIAGTSIGKGFQGICCAAELLCSVSP